MSFQNDKLRRLAVDFQTFRDRLEQVISEAGQFKDYQYEFSNISLLIKNISYICELMSFFINSMSSESSADMSKTYRAINAIAEKYGYSPTGTMAPSATVDVSLMFSNMGDPANSEWYEGGFLAIPKYTTFRTSAITPYMNLQKSKEYIQYSTTKDWYFPLTDAYTMLTAGSGTVSGAYWSFDTPMEVYNGEFVDLYCSGSGQGYQLITLDNVNLTKDVDGVLVVDRYKIDQRFIDVYVKDKYTGEYAQWNRVASLSDRLPVEKIYEIRTNAFGNYDVRFGDGVNGAVPLSGSGSIWIKYLRTNMEYGEIGSDMFVPFSNFYVTSEAYVRTKDFGTSEMVSVTADPSYWSSARDLIPDAIERNNTQTYLTSTATFDIKIEQPRASSRAVYGEPGFKIKEKMLDLSRFRGNRLGNERAFESFATNELGQYIQTAYAMNNMEYMNTLMAELISTSGYFMDTESVSGVMDPFDEYIKGADPTFFNNLYLFVVPKVSNIILHPTREQILQRLWNKKMLCANVNLMNPVFANIGFYLDIKRDESFIQSGDILRSRIRQYMMDIFAKKNCMFGQTINLASLKSGLEAIPGVGEVRNIIIFEKDYYDFNSNDIVEILSDPLGYSDDGKPVFRRNYTYDLAKYKFPVLSPGFLNSDMSININKVGADNLPYMDVV